MTAPAEPVLLALLGPTGTGKSATALRIAELTDGEIVGCDALQVYRGLDAGTSKPQPADRRRVPHHLIDCADPRVDFSMADYVRAAERVILEVAARGRRPILVGGTGLYLRGLLRGIIEAPPRDPELRRRLVAVAARRGGDSLHRWLARLDPESARRLAPADTQRVVRALEVGLSGGAVWSERLREGGTWADSRERYRCLKIGLDLDRDRLGSRLDARVDRFFEGGLVSEVRDLLRQGVPPRANAFKAIGYREVLAALERMDDPHAVRDAVKQSTRRYAKRQRTWFRKEPGIVWLDAEAGPEALAQRAIELWRQGGKRGQI